MGQISLIVEGTGVGTVAQGGGVTLVRQVSSVDSARLIAAYARSYAGRWVDDEGAPRPPTINEVLEAWFDGIIAGSVAHVQQVERDVAAQAARDAVAPISVM
ncbi:MAG: hypothetical protein MUF14_05660 [Hyphomonadaceae bacterium]|jgi:hypothetical protein|nr:hypothetical protein [Hyphomonadaceae bacterium]